MQLTSPEVSQAQVPPRKPSPTLDTSYPDLPEAEELEETKPKSGIIINEEKGSFYLVYKRGSKPGGLPFYISDPKGKKKKKPKVKPKKKQVTEAGDKKPKKRKKYKKRGDIDEVALMETTAPGVEAFQASQFPTIIEETAEDLMGYYGEGEEGGALEDEDYLTKLFRRKVSLISKATSLHTKDLMSLPSVVEEAVEEPALTKIIQKFRRDSEERRYKQVVKRIVRGTLESHSFTKLKQKTLKTFFFGAVFGSMSQNDQHFSIMSRTNQGVCMPVAAYCYSVLKKPQKWTLRIIDEILEAGDRLYRDTLEEMHQHVKPKNLRGRDLNKYCHIGDFKVKFQVGDPEVTGLVRSKDKTVYNLSKALGIFFNRYKAGVFETNGQSFLIWKKRFYFFFDARGRNPELYQKEDGVAVMAVVYDVAAIATVLLKRTDLDNAPFIISTIKALKVKHITESDKDSDTAVSAGSVYNIVDNTKAVVVGSFDLGDRCFDFSRNKQALAMAVVCLTYSRISPPTSWRKRTIDKIMIVGNQLYLECAQCDSISGELHIDSVPAVFTLGPYLVSIYIYGNFLVDLMWKKSEWQLPRLLEEFFESHNSAIVQIGRYYLAVWGQRNMYYCFDPYSRNNEGMKCRHGTACVSMISDLSVVGDIITRNFDDKETIFYIHAVKVLKIHRDPDLSRAFPATITMDSYPLEKFKKCRMKTSKKKATDKPVTVDYTEFAMKKLLAGEEPEPSIFEVGSDVGSLTSKQMPPMLHRLPIKVPPKSQLGECDVVADLDSPSLSDTQIEPERPKPDPAEFAERDIDTFDLTIEELELMTGGEEEGEGGSGDYYGEGEDYVDAMDEMYWARNMMSQVGSHSLESYHSKLSAQINTDVTCAYLPLKLEVLRPLGNRRRTPRTRTLERFEKPPITDALDVTQSEELAKDSNFVDLPDGSQIVLGTENMSKYGDELEFMAPFVSIMATAVAKKFAIISWSSDIVNYVLKCGAELYKSVNVRYDQVPVLDIPKVSLGKTDFSILVSYVFDSRMKPEVLYTTLKDILFSNYDCGLVVTPVYACTVFYKNHLFYLYDGFGNTELGMSEGPSNDGVACFARFKNLAALVDRILYNKSKRESEETYTYSRFVVSSCQVKLLPGPDFGKRVPKKSRKEKMEEEMEKQEKLEDGEGYVTATEEEEEMEAKEVENKMGYQYKDGYYTIQGSGALEGGSVVEKQLKQDHFVCLCAALMLLKTPIDKWDVRKVDLVLEQGVKLYSECEELWPTERRLIYNILICDMYFDVVVKRIQFPTWQKNKNLSTGIDTLVEEKRKNYFLIQFPHKCYVFHAKDDCYHLFDPYGCASKEKKESMAGWTKYNDLKQLKRNIKKSIPRGGESYNFYTFEVMVVRKARKKEILEHKLHLYDYERRGVKQEKLAGLRFYEDDAWLEVDPLPWSKRMKKTVDGRMRGKPDTMWHNWNIEIPKSLYSLFGTIHQLSEKFSPETRGRQTLANLTVAAAMTDIYDFEQWNAAVLNAILVNGDNYFKECIKDVEDKNYEISVDDLKSDCSIFPYTFKVKFIPVINGTMFLVHPKQFNLYKGLRVFFDTYESRCGIVSVTKGEWKKHVAFGRTQEREYFMFDCDSFGPPMFLDFDGSSYILRCTSFKRLLHVLTVTLRGGDYYIYHVDVTNFKAMR